jgi:hypothetical protein
LPGLVATLNYDHLLEEATGRRASTWQEANAVQEALLGSREAILHLHGEYRKPESESRCGGRPQTPPPASIEPSSK